MRIFAHIIALAILLLPLGAHAQDPFSQAKAAYAQEDYEVAIHHLSNLEGLLEVAPIFDRVRGEERERVLFDLARCHFAMGDTLGARIVLGELYRHDPRQSRGQIDLPEDPAVETVLSEMRELRRDAHQAQINKTSPLKASLRSLVLPGWGQMYRGRTQRGRFLAGSTVALALGWFVADRSYKSALNDYRRTSEVDLNLPGRTGGADDPNPFQDRWEKVESRASTARAMAFALASLWTYSVLENLVLQPGRVAVVVPLD